MRLINARAPVRIADLGGWTDTWFAGHGRVCSMAVTPGVDVQLGVRPRPDDAPQVALDVADFGDRYAFEIGSEPGRHPLLEQAVAEMGVPADLAVDVFVHSGVPPGCGTGTSAAVCVALLAALDGLTPGRRSPVDLASTAHRVETERLGLESGVQDQLTAALGGVCSIRVTAFPHAEVRPVRLPRGAASWELERRLVLVHLGAAHHSSDVHRRVIDRLAREGTQSGELESLRRVAEQGEQALAAGDLAAYGLAMVENTELQASLHPDLVSARAKEVIEQARAHGAAGWKVNGAGGEGGSITVLAGASAADRHRLEAALAELGGGVRVIPVALSPTGVRRWRA